jgi:hypothetical protein
MIEARSRDQTRLPPFRVNLASVPLVCSFRREENCTRPRARLSANGQTRKPKDWLAPRRPTRPNCATAALRPGCRSIPAAKFRHSAELNGATKAALNSPPNELRTQRRSRRKRL